MRRVVVAVGLVVMLALLYWTPRLARPAVAQVCVTPWRTVGPMPMRWRVLLPLVARGAGNAGITVR